MSLTLFTPTRNRPRAFSFLEQYVKRQTLSYKQWIVCCDSGFGGYEFNMGQTVIHRTEPSNLHSINANYLACLDAASAPEKVLFIEDDDWLHPEFFAHYDRWLDEYPLVGLLGNRYYNVKTKAYTRMWNQEHSSLASTGLTKQLLPLLRSACLKGDPYIDMYLWKNWLGKKLLSPDSHLHLGLKGVEGERGYGIGHNLSTPVDVDGRLLRETIGDDARNYLA